MKVTNKRVESAWGPHGSAPSATGATFGASTGEGEGFLFCPVFNVQCRNPSELELLVGDQNAFQGESVSSNQHVKTADRLALPFQLGSQFPLLLGRQIVVRQYLDWGKEFGQG